MLGQLCSARRTERPETPVPPAPVEAERLEVPVDVEVLDDGKLLTLRMGDVTFRETERRGPVSYVEDDALKGGAAGRALTSLFSVWPRLALARGHSHYAWVGQRGREIVLVFVDSPDADVGPLIPADCDAVGDPGIMNAEEDLLFEEHLAGRRISWRVTKVQAPGDAR